MADAQPGTSIEPLIVYERITKKTGEVVTKKYTRGQVLGKGGFATCYEFTDHESGTMYAAKIVAKASLTKKRALEKLLAEIKIHKSLQQENIVHFEHVFEDKENVYILLEICPNQTLKELLKKRKRLGDVETAFYLTQTINAVKYLHEKKVIHRDLKLGNLFLGKAFDIKVGDFGLAAKLEYDGEKRRTICGTPNYIAPEVLNKKQGHSFEVDVWSIGVICYTLLIGKPPFETSDTKTTYNRILKNNYSFPTNTPISEEAKDLIKKILVLEPTKRLTLDEILQHPFIKNNSSKNLTQSNEFELKKTNTNLSLGSPGGLVSPTTKDIDLDRNIDENEVNEKGSDPNSIQQFKAERTKTLKDRPMSTDPKMVRNFTYDGIVPKTLVGLNIGNPEKGFNFLGADSGVYVSKWVDYSTKYGLGYLLSDGTAGVVFNDSTRITMSSVGQKFEYMEKKPEQKREILSTYSVSNVPKELNKKYLLLQHFKNYLSTDDKSEREEFSPDPNAAKKGLNYIKKWMKTKYAFMFRLSNRLVQVDFTDKTQIILNPESQIVHYRNKKGERTQHPLTTALESDYAEMVKRLKYTKEILTHIHNSNGKDVEIKMDTKGMTIGTGFLSTKDFGTNGTGKVPKIQGADDLEN